MPPSARVRTEQRSDRIDFIYTKGLKCHHSHIDASSPSDHAFVCATVSFIS
jgi:endonuclease/exonuclease/phosphatase (EEP) superfamily protein YafD